MLGYRIHFDGERFVMDKNMSEVGDMTGDSTVCWNAARDTGIAAVNNLNESLKSKIEEITKPTDFVVMKCKDCHDYFILNGGAIEWFKRKGLKFPCRCTTCREKRKINKI